MTNYYYYYLGNADFARYDSIEELANYHGYKSVAEALEDDEHVLSADEYREWVMDE